MTIVAVEFLEPVYYIGARIWTSRAEPPGNRPNTRPRITHPQKARRVDVHEA
jgi:hypothetical protein